MKNFTRARLGWYLDEGAIWYLDDCIKAKFINGRSHFWAEFTPSTGECVFNPISTIGHRYQGFFVNQAKGDLESWLRERFNPKS